MAGYVDPFEAFKKKKEQQTSAVPAPGASVVVTPAAATNDDYAISAPGEKTEQREGKPAGYGTGRADFQPALQVETTAIKGKVASIMQETMQGVTGTLDAAALEERKIKQEKPLERGGEVEAVLVKPAGMESHRIENTETAGEIVKPAGLERTRLESDTKEKDETVVQRPANFSKY